MKNPDYWAKRMSALMDAEMHKADDYGKDVSAAYRRAARSMQADIEKWCAKFADNNGISMAEARKALKKDELEEFHWTVGEYIKHGEENGISADWTKQLVNASSRVHISRLEALQIQCYERANEAIGGLENGLHDTLSSIYEDTYYHTAYEVQKAAGHGVPFAKIDTAQVDKILSKPWAADGADFSERIWKNRTQLLQELNAGLTQGIIRGDPPDKLVQHLSKRFDVSENRAQTLVQTESTFFANQAQADNFAELGVEKYEIVAALDSTTCETCAAMDGKQFPLKEEAAGINAPPFHARCRCCKAPVVEDEVLGERAARGEDGKTYDVPEDMTYNDWKAQHVDENNVADSGEDAIIKAENVVAPERTRKARPESGNFRYLSDEEFDRLTIPAKKNGAVVLRGTEDIEKHLEARNASAATIGDALLFKKDVSISDVLEEIHHFEQNISGFNNQIPEPERTILNEIDAKQFLIDNAQKYKIPRAEIDLTRKQLQSYEDELKRLKGGD